MLADLFDFAGSCMNRGKKSEQTAQDAWSHLHGATALGRK
ncbi:hypothetical protein BFJ69_g6977 [Fusarium oxysporum]|uniref:Uncharacterized protein n=1 Tax=Fusarium oxysporum TaxID=5507 RepID=A0A420N7N5_FUSOX|nr:hypothetical protein BFJ69_g6977 [Fusarium oxysporum]